MAVKLRMTRLGRRHRPFFRINAIDSRNPRDGRIIEKLGHYDPIEKDPARQVVLNTERVKYWLDKGAIPSDSVSQILLRHGIKHKYAEQEAAKRARARNLAHAKGKPFTKADRIAIAKAAEEEAKAKEEVKAKPKEQAEAKEQAKPESQAPKEASAEQTEEQSSADSEPQQQTDQQSETDQPQSKSDEN